MAPKRDQRRDKAYEIYKQHGGKIQNRQIANMLDLPERTVGGWKSKDHWDDKLAVETNGVLQSTERSTPIEKGGTSPPRKGRKQSTRKGKQEKTKQSSGHAGAPLGNENAVTHGFYRTLLPGRLQKIAEQMEGRDLLEMLREQITVSASIIFDSLQQLYVEDMEDHRDFVTKEKAPSGAFLGVETEDGKVVLGEIEREWHTAWDRQAKALQGYERQVARFQSLVRTYMELSGDGDMFRLKIERMKQDIELDRKRFEHQKAMDEARLDLATYKALPPQDEDAEPAEPDGYNEAMGGMTAQEVWLDDDPATES